MREFYPIENRWSRTLCLLRRVGRRPVLCVLGFGMLGLVGAVLVGLLRGLALPRVHDEFSYLLSGETFARGRLTNPPHPHWEFFETFHVLQQPTYSSKYPPAQGLWLALGDILGGHPILGVWLSVGAVCAAMCWMLLAWLPPQWAVLSTLFFTGQIAWVSYWSQSYWGGAVAVMGGAIAAGAFRRIWDRPRWRWGLLLGLGFGISASSRPLEGFLLALMLSGALLFRASTVRRGKRLRFWSRGFLPASLVTAVALGGLGIHNAAVTGSPLEMPYQEYQQQYSAGGSFLFMPSRPLPEYRHAEMRDYELEWGLARRERMWGLGSFPLVSLVKLVSLGLFYLGPALLILLAGPRLPGKPWAGFSLGAVGVVVGVSLLTAGTYTHYIAPVTGLVFVVVGHGLGILHRRARARRKVNLALVAAIIVVLLVPYRSIWPMDRNDSGFPQERDEITRQLLASPGRDLVFVEYSEGHSVHEEWVYNHADIDDSQVVWARSMGPSKNQVLVDYYPDRVTWVLAVSDSVRLAPYDPPEAPSSGPAVRGELLR